MSAKLISTELKRYFGINWKDTAINISSDTFNDSGLERWISISYSPIPGGNSTIGMDGTTTGRIENIGLFSVLCYSRKNRDDALALSDEVGLFLNGKILPYDIQVQIGQQQPPINLDGSVEEVIVEFRIIKN